MLLGNETFSETKCVEIAKEHSGFICEFVFVNASEKAELKLSYYSSECEVDFCGHGTIATMYELIKNDKDLVRKTEIRYLEDPATGSGNSAFANYLLANGYWDGNPIVIEQGGDNIEFDKVNLRTKGDKVLFGGSATLKIEGYYYSK